MKEVEPEKEQTSARLQDFCMTPILFPGQMVPYEKLAEERLRDPGLLDWIKIVLSQRIVGEDNAKLLVFLIGLSYKTEEPQSCIVSGPPSTGKSYVCKNVLRLMPNVINVSRMTPAFLDRIGADLTHYILYVSELGGAEQSLPILRVMLSEGELVLGTTERNEKGKIETMIIETKGSPVYVTTTSQEIIERQLASRTWLLGMDTSEEQTRAILRYQALRARSPSLPEFSEEEMVLRTLVYMLKPYKVMVPFTERLGELFPSTEPQARRDFNRLLSLIKTVTLLFQRQRFTVKISGEDHLVASLTDLVHALKLIKPVLLPTLYGLPQKAFDLLKIFQEAGLEEFTVKDIAAKAELSDNRAREILNALVDRGFVHKDVSQKAHTYSWTGKTLEDGTILSIVVSSEFFSLEEFEKWLNENRCGCSEDIKKVYETYISPGSLLSPEHPQRFENTAKPNDLAQEKPKDVTTEQIVALSKTSTESIKAVLALEPSYVGFCAYCGQRRTLTWQVQYFNGDLGDACQDCGASFLERVKGDLGC
jgi:hypothetical protein